MARRRQRIAAVTVIFAFFSLCVQSPVPVFAGALNEGLDDLAHRRYTPAFRTLEPLANQGVPEAQEALGWMYEQGLHVHRNFLTADMWYHRAVAQGNRAAGDKRAAMQARVERQFQEGMEAMRTKDYTKAKDRWWDLAFQGEHPAAQTNLGFLYANGLGIKRDYEAARRWYQRAIAQKYLPAQENLKLLEESIKAEQARPMSPQRQAKKQTLSTGESALLIFIGVLMLTSTMQPSGSGYTQEIDSREFYCRYSAPPGGC